MQLRDADNDNQQVSLISINFSSCLYKQQWSLLSLYDLLLRSILVLPNVTYSPKEPSSFEKK